jgi:hypothetical protein
MTAGTQSVPPIAARRGGSGYAFPVLLVALGVYALLVNAGAVHAPRWNELLALWPLLLVIGGLDILLARRAPLLGLLIITAVVTIALVAVSAGAAAAPVGLVDRMSVATDGASAGSVKLSFAGGRLAVGGGGAALAQVSSDRDDVGSSLARTEDRVTLELRRDDAVPIMSGTEWTVSLSDAVRYDLDVDLAAGEFDLDLRSVSITSAEVNAAMADLYLVLPRPQGDARVTVDAAMSSVVIAVPRGTAARITSDGVIGTFTGGEYGGYASAPDRLTVVAKGAFVSIQVRELP